MRYETTPEQLRYILVEIRKLLYAHPKVDNDPARVRFVNFGAYSLDLEIFAYVRVPTTMSTSRSPGSDLRIMDTVQSAGSSFAFPSQTMYVESGGGLDTQQARAAEEQVRRWREEGTLWLRNFRTTRSASWMERWITHPKGRWRDGRR